MISDAKRLGTGMKSGTGMKLGREMKSGPKNEIRYWKTGAGMVLDCSGKDEPQSLANFRNLKQEMEEIFVKSI